MPRRNDDDDLMQNWRDLFAIWLVGSIAVIIVVSVVWSFFAMVVGLE